MINTRLAFLKTFALPCIIIIAHGLSFFGVSIMMAAGCRNDQSPVADTSLSFKVIPYDDDDIVAPGRGAEQWHDQDRVKLRTDSSNVKRFDKYYRFSWKDIEKGNGEYDWSAFDREINDAIKNKQKFG